MHPLIIGALGIGFAAAALYFLENPPWEWESERRRNVEMGPDWDEAWERLQQAHAYHLRGDLGHARLRLLEAMHHADRLPRAQQAVIMDKIVDLVGIVGL